MSRENYLIRSLREEEIVSVTSLHISVLPSISLQRPLLMVATRGEPLTGVGRRGGSLLYSPSSVVHQHIGRREFSADEYIRQCSS